MEAPCLSYGRPGIVPVSVLSSILLRLSEFCPSYRHCTTTVHPKIRTFRRMIHARPISTLYSASQGGRMTTKRIASMAALVVLTAGLGLAQQLQQRFDMMVR